MIKLSKEQYNLPRALIQTLPINHFFALTVLEGKADGEVFADSQTSPAAFYIKHPYGMSLLFGEALSPSFKSSLNDYLTDLRSDREKEEWLQVYPTDWIEKLPSLTHGKNEHEESHERVNFRFDPVIYKANRGNEQLLPGRATISKTSKGDYTAVAGSVTPNFFWRNADDFWENGIGYSVMIDGTPVCTAFSAFVHPPCIELGIETDPEYRGQGLAYAACCALIDYCLTNGYEPVWACRAGNAASMKLARKLGFVETLRLPYFHLRGPSLT